VGPDITGDVFVDAAPEDVFEYFTRPELLETWMGERAELEARPGGSFAVYVKGTAVRGRYLELDPPKRLLISWGFAGSSELPPGASTLEVRLLPERQGTRVGIRHRLLPAGQRAAHASGWPRYLARLSEVASPGGSLDDR
jgi:uncharacterized protein YndB with AHSA1/START domain